MEIGKFIREERKAKGWSMEALARKAEVSYNTIHNIEKGKHLPALHVILSILDALDLEMTFTKKNID